MKFIQPISMKRLLDLFKNKFFLVTLAFFVWMTFFDRNDLFSQYEYRSQVHKLEKERDFYKVQTDQVTKELKELTSNPQQLEKFAREKYLMKKDNEDVYLIVPQKTDK